jgi:hypothetical protein
VSGRGRPAAIPPAEHSRPDALAGGGLVVHHYNRRGECVDYAIALLPVAEPMQRSLAALFAAHCVPHRWSAHATSKSRWGQVRSFAQFLAAQPQPVCDVDGLTALLIKQWRLQLGGGSGAVMSFNLLSGLQREDARLQTGPAAEELARRARLPKSQVQSYPEAEFDKVKAAARRTFRSALKIHHPESAAQRGGVTGFSGARAGRGRVSAA